MKKLLLCSMVLAGLSASAQSWVVKSSGFTAPSRAIFGFSIVDANVAWAFARDGSGAAAVNVRDVTLTTNAGENWTAKVVNPPIGQINSGNTSVGSLSAIDATTAYVSAFPGGPNGSNAVLKTTNGGTSWTKLATGYTSASFANIIHFFNSNDGITAGDPTDGYFEVYTTSDAGATWTRVASAALPAPLSADEYGYTNTFSAVGNTLWFGTSKGRIFRTTDKGLTWAATQTLIADFNGSTVALQTESTGLILGGNGFMYRSTDGGATFLPVIYTGPVYTTDLDFVGTSPQAVSVSVNAAALGTSYTADGGDTWTDIPTPTGMDQFTAVEFLNGTTGYGGGFSTDATTGGIYKYVGTELKKENFNFQNQVSLYPNPTTGVINLSGKGISNVVVYNLLGKQVLTQNFSTLDEASVDMTGLASGAYLVKASSENGAVQTIKVLKN